MQTTLIQGSNAGLLHVAYNMIDQRSTHTVITNGTKNIKRTVSIANLLFWIYLVTSSNF